MQNVFHFMAVPTFIVEFDHNRWYIRDLNQAFTTLSGYKKSELLEADPSGLLKEGIAFGLLIARLTDDGSDIAETEWELVGKSTMTCPVRISCRTLQADDRTYFIIMCQDLSEDKWIEEYAVENEIAASLAVSDQFRIRTVKRYFTPVKHKASMFVGSSVFDFVAEPYRKPLKRVMEYSKSSGTVERTELELQIGDASYNASVVIKPFYNGSKSFKGFCVIITSLHRPAQEEDPSFKLRMLMLNKNISATSLAQSTLISLTTISKIRNGKIKKPQRLTAELIAGELGVKPEMIWSSFKR